MIREKLSNEQQDVRWKEIVSSLSQQFIDHVFDDRKVKEEIKPYVASELLIYLGLLLGAKLNEEFSEDTAIKVIKFYMQEVYVKAQSMEISYQDVLGHTSQRHDFYVDGLFDEANGEDFLRATAMFWFQFPLTGRDAGIRPHEYDFSVYFSDIPIVSEIIFQLTPMYATAIMEELKIEVPSFM